MSVECRLLIALTIMPVQSDLTISRQNGAVNTCLVGILMPLLTTVLLESHRPSSVCRASARVAGMLCMT